MIKKGEFIIERHSKMGMAYFCIFLRYKFEKMNPHHMYLV